MDKLHLQTINDINENQITEITIKKIENQTVQNFYGQTENFKGMQITLYNENNKIITLYTNNETELVDHIKSLIPHFKK